MSNFNIRINGAANLGQVKTEFGKLVAEVDLLNAAMERSVVLANGVNPQGYARMSQAVKMNSQMTRNAALSTGMFEVQQLRLNSATEEYTKLVEKQKLSFREWYRERGRLSKAAYREQLALQQMVVKQMPGTVGGRKVLDVYIPNEVHKDFDTLGNRIGWIREELKSASTQMVNWGKNTQWAGRQLMVGFTMPTLAFGAATGVLAYQVDKEMTRIQKVYDTTAQVVQGNQESMIAVEKELAQVRVDSLNTARMAAEQYGQSVTDTLKVQADLAATGLKGQNLQQSTLQTMRIATLGELDMESSINMTVALQSAFKDTIRTSQDLTNAFNFMNATENATSLSIKDIAEAIPRAGSAMAALGVNVEEMTVLLTSMKESGVDAAEAANALKSATSAILRPSPAADEFIQQISDGRVQVMQLAEASGGNLYQAMQILYNQMEGMDKLQQQQVLTTLFGRYQYNRLAAVFENLGTAMTKGGNQTAKAIELMGTSTTDLADLADREVARIQKSLSGQFKSALESVKIELAEMGEPFLEVGVQILKVIKNITEAFNSMPDSIKKGFAIASIVAAVFGPLVMLGGLTANFAGNILKGGVAIAGLATNFKLLNKESAAAKLAAELAQQGFVDEGRAISLLRAEMEKLTLAAQEGALAQKQFMLAANSAAQVVNGRVAGQVPIVPDRLTRTQTYGLNIVPADGPYTGPVATPTGRSVVGASGRTAIPDPIVSTKSVENAKETSKWLQAGAVSAGISAAAMGTMMFSSNETANNIAQFALLASIAAPAFSAMAAGLKAVPWASMSSALSTRAAGAATKIKTGIAAAGTELAIMGHNLRSRQGIAYEMGVAGKRAKALGSATKGALKNVVGMVSPLGWAGIAIAGVAAGAYMLHKHLENIKKEQIENQKALTKTADSWADILEVTQKQNKELKGMATATSVGGKSITELADAFKDTESGGNLIEAYNEAGSEAERSTIALGQYLTILRETDATSTQARKGLEIMFVAAGAGALEAASKAKEFWLQYRDLDMHDMVELWTQQLTNLSDMTTDQAKAAGGEIGKVFVDSLAAGGKKNMDAGVDDMVEAIQNGWGEVISDMNDSSQDLLADIGIDKTNVRSFIAKWKDVVYGELSQTDFISQFGLDSADAGDLQVLMAELNNYYAGAGGYADNLRDSEEKIVKELMKQAGIVGDLNTLAELRASWDWKVYTATRKNAQALYEEQVARENFVMGQLTDILGARREITEERKLEILNQLRANVGLEDAYYLSQGFKDETKETADNADNMGRGFLRSAAALKNMKDALKEVDWADTYRSAMEDAQGDIANIATSNFDNMMNNAMDAYRKSQEDMMQRLEDAQDRASEAMERRHERETRAFDKHWENRTETVENHFDSRIEKINEAIAAEEKAEEIRQRIFEAEMQRMDRWAQMQNQNIDFNVALNTGQLDEAAKIRNDMIALESEWALGDAADASSRRSERRRQRMEGRIDGLEKSKDARLEAIQEAEEAERRALERRQERESRYLERMQELRREALQEEIDNNIAAQEEIWQNRRENLDKAIELFQAYVPRNERDLREHVARISQRYSDFNVATKGKFNKTAVDVGQMLAENVTMAARAIRSDIQWAAVGDKIAESMIRGAFGMSPGQFQKWLMSGKWPKGAKINQGGDFGGRVLKDPADRGFFFGDGGGVYHTGGIVGVDRGGQAGIRKGHPDEVNITALKGEGVLNRDAMAKLGTAGFRALNSGRGTERRGTGGEPMIGMGMAGIMAAGLFRGLQSTIRQAIINGHNARVARNQKMLGPGGSFGTGNAGNYSDRFFDEEQLRNAATIATVGRKMGMSARDIKIGIMTAITESGLRNVNYGDRDSVGLFQQRTSQGWGSVEQIMNPEYAAGKFFSALKTITNRDDMAPWLAAQAVQRSAYSDGSNYKQYWDNAIAIWADGLSAQGGEYIPGIGGWQKPSAPGKGWLNTHDYQNGIGSPLYAVSNGKVVESRAVTSGGSPGNGLYTAPNGLPYRSYGETIVIQAANGDLFRYAHLAPGKRFVKVGDTVQGGALIGRSGNTGNSTGPHTHFDVNGDYNAKGWLASHGVSLSKGAANINYDGVPAVLHKNEAVLTEDLNSKFKQGVDNFSDPSAFAQNLILNSLKYFPTDQAADKITEAIENQQTGDVGNVRVGTYNVSWRSGIKTTAPDLKRLMGETDALGLQEVYRGRVDEIKATLANNGWGMSDWKNDSLVAYNKAKYDMTKTGTMWMNPGRHGKGTERNRNAAWATLKSKTGGGKFSMISAHTQPWPNKGPFYKSIQQEQYRNLGGLYGRLSNQGPVVLVGDLNEDLRRNPIKIANLISNWEGNMKGKGTHGNSWIDHIMFGPGSKLLNNRVIGGLASDHNAVVSTLSLSKGAQNIRWDNTLANLHKGEAVLTEDINNQFREGVRRFAEGPNSQYNLHMTVNGADVDADELVNKTMTALRRMEMRRPQSRSGM